MSGVTVVTGGAGYVGAATTEELLASGRRVRILDVLLHGQEEIAASLQEKGVEVIRGDIRDAEARRRALEGAEAVVHLAAIVGDPACALDPGVRRGQRRGKRRRWSPTRRRRASSASCSLRRARTTAAWPTRPCRSPRTASSARSRSTPSRRSAMETADPRRATRNGLRPTCLRFATVYGVGAAHALRPDGQRVHARTVGRPASSRSSASSSGAPTSTSATPARAVRTVLDAPEDEGRRRGVQRRPLGRELPQARHRRGDRPADRHAATSPTSSATRTRATTRSASTRSASVLGFETLMTVPDGIAEIIAALSTGALRRSLRAPATGTLAPRDPRCRSSTCRLEPEDLDAVAETLRSGWLTHGPADGGRSSRRSPSTLGRQARGRGVELHRRAASRLPRRGRRPRRRGDRAVVHVRGDGRRGDLLRRHAGVRRHRRPARPRARPGGRRAARSPRAPRPSAAVHFAGYPAPVDSLKELCDAHGIALIEDVAHAPGRARCTGGKLGTLGLAGAFSFFSNKVLSVRRGRPARHRRRRRGRARRLAALARHDLGTWDRHSRPTDTYDVVGPRLQLPARRAALGAAALAPARAWSTDIERRRELTRATARRLAESTGIIVPFTRRGRRPPAPAT